MSPDNFNRKVRIQAELYDMNSEEEMYWFQRSHARWLLHGDLNTSYFHKISNGRKRKNMLHSLEDNGTLVEGTDNRLQIATDYYKNLFGPAPGNVFSISHELWSQDEVLCEDDNIDLTRPFSVDEVKNALFSMDTNRAPGPDNIPTEFYQHCWEVVQHDIMNIFYHFHAGSLDVQRLNYGVITLLPKIAEANKIHQFRPICLLRCIYKIITKTLTLRLEPYAKKLFSIQQNAFSKNRNIVDGIMSLHEVMQKNKYHSQD